MIQTIPTPKWKIRVKDKSLRAPLRSLPLATQCHYYGDVLTWEEIKAKQLAGCRACDGKIRVRHCTFPGKKAFNDGPYTRGAECMNCTDWKKKQDNLHVSTPPAAAAIPDRQPASLRLLLTLGEETHERVLPGLLTDYASVWADSGKNWVNVSLMECDGPARYYRFSMEWHEAGKKVAHIYAARLMLLSSSPFYAVSGGLFVDCEKTAVADDPAWAGKKWAVSVAEAKA